MYFEELSKRLDKRLIEKKREDLWVPVIAYFVLVLICIGVNIYCFINGISPGIGFYIISVIAILFFSGHTHELYLYIKKIRVIE